MLHYFQRLRTHPDKTFVSKAQKGCDFLGFHLRPTGMCVSETALSRRDAKVARLYEQGASKRRIGLYLARWLGWAALAAWTAAWTHESATTADRPVSHFTTSPCITWGQTSIDYDMNHPTLCSTDSNHFFPPMLRLARGFQRPDILPTDCVDMHCDGHKKTLPLPDLYMPLMEGTAGAHYSLMLLTPPQSEVTIELSTKNNNGSDSDNTVITPMSLTFTSYNWYVPQDVIIYVIDDSLPKGNFDHAPIVHKVSSKDLDYDQFPLRDVQIHITDNDVPNLNGSAKTLNVTEGNPGAKLNLALTTKATNDVIVNITGGEQLEVVPNTVTFKPGEQQKPLDIEVSAKDDNDLEGPHHDTILLTTHSLDFSYDQLEVVPITVNITDNDTAGITLSKHDLTVIQGSDNDHYTMALTVKPTKPVEIYLTSSQHTQVSPFKVTFSPDNWKSPQTITVIANAEDLVYGEDSYINTIMHAVRSDDPNYNGYPIENVSVTIVK